MTHALLEVDNLSHTYYTDRGEQRVLDGLSFSVNDGEFVSIVGPSGCGKTTLLRTLSGLLKPTGGSISLGGTEINGVPEGLAMVFQDYRASLFPWRRVGANVEFPLLGVVGKAERRRRTEESLAAVGLEGMSERYPWQLSGGMQQRVAIARALAMRPKLMLMDEPFASVDAQTRSDLEDLLLRVRDQYDMTILFVTHDVDESVYLSTRVVSLSKAPTVKTADIRIPLQFPRDQISTREEESFVTTRGEVARLIRQACPGGLTVEV
ncbi:sugar ABC transporter (plasmid) [Rhodococcus erythropolis R138]|jgi:NitT/TauT family transport system ATP-binding protein|uniref:ABC transporter ATP-binding protein n=1 Tax=Rhodococcus erythropolis TaxID=1833 RepID=UPI0007393709|nr:ABC transporter ATP-binding protein [Rhodococcus erythropolis]ALU73670.1 sugar ABC transporter [Rhodococcus erythropolis R138]PBI85117.1 Bicarbonate transport ATP-binding protein CmpD [Rhodococcus erythropolis]